MRTYCKKTTIDKPFIMAAYQKWLKAPAGHKNAWRIEREFGKAENLVSEITDEVRNRCLSFNPIHRYEHVEPINKKVRTIGVLSVKQQVVDYVIVSALEPMLDAKIGFYQVASVPGKGAKLARSALRKWAHEGGYHVKLDVRKCYQSISHDVVTRIVSKHVRNADVLYMLETTLATYEHGLEIGSYLSLRLAQLVLSYPYHYIESLQKERRGKHVRLVKHQVWHLDDALLLGSNKRDLKMAVRKLERYMRNEFGLTLKPWKIAKTNDGEPLDLSGFIIRSRRTTLRPTLFLRARRAFARFRRKRSESLARRACSYYGWLKHSNAARFTRANGVIWLLREAKKIISKQDRRKAYACDC